MLEKISKKQQTFFGHLNLIIQKVMSSIFYFILIIFFIFRSIGGWRKKSNHFADGGDFGNREQYINQLLRKMV
jgi:hypothetical protein